MVKAASSFVSNPFDFKSFNGYFNDWRDFLEP